MVFAFGILLFHMPLSIVFPAEGRSTTTPVCLALVRRVNMTRKIRFTGESARAGTAYVRRSIRLWHLQSILIVSLGSLR